MVKMAKIRLTVSENSVCFQHKPLLVIILRDWIFQNKNNRINNIIYVIYYTTSFIWLKSEKGPFRPKLQVYT